MSVMMSFEDEYAVREREGQGEEERGRGREGVDGERG